MFTVETDVPMPASPIKREPKYPFAKMRVGDSFVVADAKARGNALCAAMSFACTAAGSGTKFASRKQPDGRYRIWRTA